MDPGVAETMRAARRFRASIQNDEKFFNSCTMLLDLASRCGADGPAPTVSSADSLFQVSMAAARAETPFNGRLFAVHPWATCQWCSSARHVWL
jgi:hypothetical protein